MKSAPGFILGVVMLMGCPGGLVAQTQDTPPNCEVPDYLLTTERSLPKVADALKCGLQTAGIGGSVRSADGR